MLHNVAVAAYFADGKRNALRLAEQLERLRGAGAGEDVHKPARRAGQVAAYNVAVLLLQSRFYERALEVANELFDDASELPHWLAVRTGLLIAELGLLLSREEGELSPHTSNRVTYALDWIDARVSQPRPPATDGDAPEGKTLKFALHVYRAKFALATGQKNTCKRELKAAGDLLDAATATLPLAMSLSVVRAHLHFSLSDYSNALEMIGGVAGLVDHSGSDDHVAATVYFNNLGCIHHKMKKFNAAAYYFSKALAADEKAVVGLPASGRHGITAVIAPNAQRYFEVLYNLGLTLLVLGKPQLAFDSFNEAMQCPHFGWWRHWLRSAECVIQAHVAQLKQERRRYKNNLGIQSGNGERSRIVLPAAYTLENEGVPFLPMAPAPVAPVENKRKGSAVAVAGGSGGDIPLSLRFALECLVNARTLLSAGHVPHATTFSTSDAESSDLGGCCIRGPPRGSASDVAALVCCLLDVAYLSLAAEDPLTAVEAAQAALALRPSSPDFVHLARTYLAEALVMVGHCDEALVHLRPPAPSEAEEVPQLARGAGGMRVVLYTNFVTVLLFRGEYDRAQQVLQAALSLSPNPSPDLFLLQGYLTLRTRRDRRAVLVLLKRGRPLPRAKRAR